MKTEFTIKNFRSFDKNGVTIEFAPLTFLVGCNSSGKSSIVKALSLLKTFNKDGFTKDRPVLGSPIDFSVSPNSSLGSFKNVVHSLSRDKAFSFSYQIHSSYIDDDVVVGLTIGEGDLGNGKVIAVRIAKKDGTILVSASLNNKSGKESDTHSFTLDNLASLKEAFKQYLVATRFRDKVNDEYRTRIEIESFFKESLCYCDKDYLIKVRLDNSILSPSKDSCSEQSIIKFAETGIITYYAIFDELRGLTDYDEIVSFLKSKVSEGGRDESIKGALIQTIDFLCNDMKQKGYTDFVSYYRFLEESCIYSFAFYFQTKEVLFGSSRVEPILGARSLSPNLVYQISDGWSPKDTSVFGVYRLASDLFSLLVNEDDAYYSVVDDLYRGEGEDMKHQSHPLMTDVFGEYVGRFVQEVVSKDATDGLQYIGSSRIQVRRMYPMEDRNEFTDAVRRYFEIKRKFSSLDPPIKVRVENSEKEDVMLVSDFVPGSFMNKWLRKLKIGHHINLEIDKYGLGLLLKIYRSESDKKGMLLADMGYGITQLFSILLQVEEMIMTLLYRFKTDVGDRVLYLDDYISNTIVWDPGTLAIEEPEIHLHPKFQSLLAEMLYDAYKDYGIHFIIETHSEYLLRKIQTLVGGKVLTPEEVSMIYVDDDEEVKKGAQKVRRIPVKEDGRLAAPFGPGFYDEAGSLSRELLKKAIAQKEV